MNLIRLISCAVVGVSLSIGCGDSGPNEPRDVPEPPLPQLPPAGASGSATTGPDGTATISFGDVRVDFKVRDQSGAPVLGAWALATVGDSLLAVAVADTLGRFVPEIAVIDKALFLSSETVNRSPSLSHYPGTGQPQPAIGVATVTLGVVLVLADIVNKALAVWELGTEPPGYVMSLDNGLWRECYTADFADVVSLLSLAPGGGLLHLAKGRWVIALVHGFGELALGVAAEHFEMFQRDRALVCKFTIGDPLASIDVIVVQSISLGGILAESLTPPGYPPSSLYVVQVAPDGEDILVGPLHTAAGDLPVITDIAVRVDGSESISVFAVSFDELYRVKRATNGLELVGNLGVDGQANALAFDDGGTLFGATLEGSFFRIDTATGSAEVIGSFGSGLQSWGDIVFAPDGKLYATVITPEGTGILTTVDRNTGQGTPVAPGTSIGFDNVWGLAYHEDRLYGVTVDYGLGHGELIEVNTNDGTGSFVRNLTFDAGGAGSALRPPPR